MEPSSDFTNSVTKLASFFTNPLERRCCRTKALGTSLFSKLNKNNEGYAISVERSHLSRPTQNLVTISSFSMEHSIILGSFLNTTKTSSLDQPPFLQHVDFGIPNGFRNSTFSLKGHSEGHLQRVKPQQLHFLHKGS
ncbi:hypothetical protein V8G54_013385 [Vigna mungo]|uniref:Uncharacterized protein n=1 Tax=Vigna mungo TaxID=3915 RepID=A0AAQ3S1G7_VIGMU